MVESMNNAVKCDGGISNAGEKNGGINSVSECNGGISDAGECDGWIKDTDDSAADNSGTSQMWLRISLLIRII